MFILACRVIYFQCIASTDTQSPTSSDVSTGYTVQTPGVNCCCRCCSASDNICHQCDNPSLTDALSCADIHKPTTVTPAPPTLTPVQSATPKFKAPKQMEGSQFPERLALTASSLAQQQLTETLASLPTSTKVDLGFQQLDIIVDCTYDGVTCIKT